MEIFLQTFCCFLFKLFGYLYLSHLSDPALINYMCEEKNANSFANEVPRNARRIVVISITNRTFKCSVFPVSIIFVGFLKPEVWLFINLPWRLQNKSATHTLISGSCLLKKENIRSQYGAEKYSMHRVSLITNCASKCGVFSRFNHLYRPFKTGVMTL